MRQLARIQNINFISIRVNQVKQKPKEKTMLKLLSNSIMKSIIPRQSLTVTVTTSAKYGQQETVQQEEKSYKYDVPHYKKIEAWDKENNNVKILGKIMGSKVIYFTD